MVRWGGIVAAACLGAAANAQQVVRPRLEAAFGRSIPDFLGSEDPRSNAMLMAGFGGFSISPKLRIGRVSPEGILLGYWQRSTSPGASGQPPNATDAYGVMGLLRYTGPRRDGIALFGDLGIGIQYADQRTVDLSGRGSFTPCVGFGLSFVQGSGEWTLGARFVHISNAGFSGNNQGQNQVYVTLGYRF